MATENIRIKYTVEKKQLDDSNKSLKEAQKQNNLTQKEVDETTSKYKSQNKELNGMNGTMKKVGATLLAVFAADRIIDFAKGVVKTTGEFQKMEAVLKNTLGSNSKAQKALKDIANFAAVTPFSVSQLTNSFIKLANQGFVPTIAEMRKLGDIAASTGKDFDMLAEAIIDAQVGEFERLKEFGIRSQKEGDKVKFTFKGVKTQVDFTSESIQGYILSLGDIQGVAGSTAAISATVAGKVSNLGDNFENIQKVIGDSSSGLIGGFLTMANDGLRAVADAIEGTPVERIREEQTELNALVGALNQSNISEEARSAILETISSQYDTFLEGLDLETVTNEELTERLKEVNTEYEKRIKLMVKQDALSDIQERLNGLIRQEQRERVALAKAIQEGDEVGQSIAEEFLDSSIKQKTEVLKELAAQEKLVTEALGLGGDTSVDGVTPTATKSTGKSPKVEAKKEEIEEIEALTMEAILKEAEMETALFEKREEEKELAIENLIAEQEEILAIKNEARLQDDLVESQSTAYRQQLAQEEKQSKINAALGSLEALKQIAGEQSKVGKAAAIAQATINVIQGVTAALGSAPPPFNFVLAALTGAAGAIQIGRLAGISPPKFEKGGRIGGKLHSQGGTLIEAEVNEHVMSRKATAKYGHGLFDRINKLELNPDIVSGKSGGSSVTVVDTTPIANAIKKQPQTSINIDEEGFGVRQRRNQTTYISKLNRYST